uniref:DDE-1 domain-containing protein n=1 Tax=Trichuris muris TaxID=70415 RepID=A0A5S6QB42_TRIMR
MAAVKMAAVKMAAVKMAAVKMAAVKSAPSSWPRQVGPVKLAPSSRPRQHGPVNMAPSRWNQAAWVTAHLFTSWFTDYFKPTVEAYCAENKIPFKILLIMDNALCHPRAVVGMYKEINVVFLPANTSCLLQPMDQGVISTFKFYYLRNTLRMAINAIDKDTSQRDGKNKLKNFWKAYSILDAIKNIRDSWKEISRATLKGAWEALMPSLPDNWEGTQASVNEVTEDVLNIARELQQEIEQEDVTEMLQSHDKPLTDEELFLIDEQRRSFLEVERTHHRVDVHQAKMTTKDLKRYIELVDEAAAGLERIDPNFERSSTVSKMLSESISCYKEIHRERKRRSVQQASLLRYLSKLPQ